MRLLLWSEFEPADEREAYLYMQAYRRTALFFWQAVAFLFPILLLLPERSAIPSNVLLVFFIFLEAVSVIPGWLFLRKEDLQMKRRERRETRGLHEGIVLLWILMILCVGWVMAVPTHYFLAILALVVGMKFVSVVWAWHALNGHTTHVRVIGSIFLAEMAVGYLVGRIRPTWVRILQAIVAPLVLTGVLLVYVVVSMSFFVTPYVISTSAFEPELTQGTYVLVERQLLNVEVGDFVVIRGLDTDRLGRLLAVVDGIYQVQTATEITAVRSKDVVGEVQTDFFGQSYLQAGNLSDNEVIVK